MNTTMFKLKSKNCTYDWNISFDEKLILRNVRVLYVQYCI